MKNGQYETYTQSVTHVEPNDAQGLPIEIAQIPNSIAHAMPAGTNIVWTRIYSVHQASSTGPQRGDMSILVKLSG